MGLIDRILAKQKQRELNKLKLIADKVEALADKYAQMTDKELNRCTPKFKNELLHGKTLEDILPDAYACFREASTRVLKLRHFYVQILGGIVIHQGRIAEMGTGEGKTLMSGLPVYLNALTEKGVHVVTVNEYLAKRDAEQLGRVYNFLGLTVGVTYSGQPYEEKREAYKCDITYGTNSEFGFDYLRDSSAKFESAMLQRGLNFAIVDEVDSILIDEARTPLIISSQKDISTSGYIKANAFARTLKQSDEEKGIEGDFEIDIKDKTISLTERGIERAERYYKIDNLGATENLEIYRNIRLAIRANYMMTRDVDYMVNDKRRVVILDEFTGRALEGRRFSDGLHSAIEAKEGVPIQKENTITATITYQNYFRLYGKLSGMTGTAMTEEQEFRDIYGLDIVQIPTNKPCIRIDEYDALFADEQSKYKAIIEDIKKCRERHQPILIGTISVEKSEALANALRKEGITDFVVLNAKEHKKESEIIAQAGRVDSITIATNMAGRGTDIMLGGNPEFLAKKEFEKYRYPDRIYREAVSDEKFISDEALSAREMYQKVLEECRSRAEQEKQIVLEAGGLRIIGTERHESRRIDNQLRGRSGRQGDPGSSKFYVSLDDALLKRFGGVQDEAVKRRLALINEYQQKMPLELGFFSKRVEKAQKTIESRNYEGRKNVLKYDDVLNKQRKIIFADRNKMLFDRRKYIETIDMLDKEIKNALISSRLVRYDYRYLDYDALNKKLARVFLLAGDSDDYLGEQFLTKQDLASFDSTSLRQKVKKRVKAYYQKLDSDFKQKCSIEEYSTAIALSIDFSKNVEEWNIAKLNDILTAKVKDVLPDFTPLTLDDARSIAPTPESVAKKISQNFKKALGVYYSDLAASVISRYFIRFDQEAELNGNKYCDLSIPDKADDRIVDVLKYDKAVSDGRQQDYKQAALDLWKELVLSEIKAKAIVSKVADTGEALNDWLTYSRKNIKKTLKAGGDYAHEFYNAFNCSILVKYQKERFAMILEAWREVPETERKAEFDIWRKENASKSKSKKITALFGEWLSAKFGDGSFQNTSATELAEELSKWFNDLINEDVFSLDFNKANQIIAESLAFDGEQFKNFISERFNLNSLNKYTVLLFTAKVMERLKQGFGSIENFEEYVKEDLLDAKAEQYVTSLISQKTDPSKPATSWEFAQINQNLIYNCLNKAQQDQGMDLLYVGDLESVTLAGYVNLILDEVAVYCHDKWLKTRRSNRFENVLSYVVGAKRTELTTDKTSEIIRKRFLFAFDLNSGDKLIEDGSDLTETALAVKNKLDDVIDQSYIDINVKMVAKLVETAATLGKDKKFVFDALGLPEADMQNIEGSVKEFVSQKTLRKIDLRDQASSTQEFTDKARRLEWAISLRSAIDEEFVKSDILEDKDVQQKLYDILDDTVERVMTVDKDENYPAWNIPVIAKTIAEVVLPIDVIEASSGIFSGSELYDQLYDQMVVVIKPKLEKIYGELIERNEKNNLLTPHEYIKKMLPNIVAGAVSEQVDYNIKYTEWDYKGICKTLSDRLMPELKADEIETIITEELAAKGHIDYLIDHVLEMTDKYFDDKAIKYNSDIIRPFIETAIRMTINNKVPYELWNYDRINKELGAQLLIGVDKNEKKLLTKQSVEANLNIESQSDDSESADEEIEVSDGFYEDETDSSGTRLGYKQILAMVLNNYEEIMRENLQAYDRYIRILARRVTFSNFEKGLMLKYTDEHWINYIDDASALREGIYLRSYAQQDPLVSFQKETSEMFNDMLDQISEDIVLHVLGDNPNKFFNIKEDSAVDKIRRAKRDTGVIYRSRDNAVRKIKAPGPNDPCPCGSGKKYKNCCMRKPASAVNWKDVDED